MVSFTSLDVEKLFTTYAVNKSRATCIQIISKRTTQTTHSLWHQTANLNGLKEVDTSKDNPPELLIFAKFRTESSSV